jgi:phosphoglucosamine mutase
MRRHGYNVGGEQSGHIVLSDHVTTGDGLVSALQVLAVVVGTGRSVSEVCKRFDRLPQVLQNVRYDKSADPLAQASVKKAIEAGTARLGSTGRVLIRASGTEPVIRVMAEGRNEQAVKDVVSEISAAVERAATR